MRNTGLATIILLLGLTMVSALSIAPNHDGPCVVGDAWAEDCLSCVCLEGKVPKCVRTFCASKLLQISSSCKEGEITKVGCNTCVCRHNEKKCTSKKCSH